MDARRRERAAAGMTLVELIAAMTIFLGLAGMVLQVLGGGLDLWSSGERTRDESEQASALLDRISAELRQAIASDGGDGEPRVKFYCDLITLDSDRDGRRDFRTQRLVFVRWLFEERTNQGLAQAGTNAAGAIAFTGAADAAATDFLPTESMTEAAFVPQPDVRSGYEGRCVLWRALKSPIGGKDSLFALALKDESGLDGASLEPLAENVLYVGFSFIDDTVDDVAAAPDAKGPLVLWDSTRGILPAGEGYSGFRHARGAASLADPDDDVFPEAVRVTVIIAAPPGEAPVAQIVNELPASDQGFRVDLKNGGYLKKLGAAARLLKIGHEWVEAADTDGNTLFIVKRGQLGTATALHPEGTKVLVGRRFERVIPLPARRFDLISRDLPRDDKRSAR